MSEKFNMLHVLLNSDRRPLRISYSKSKFKNMSFASVDNFMFANVLPDSVDTFDLVSCKDPHLKFFKIRDKIKTAMLRKYLDEALLRKKQIKVFSDVLEMIPNESQVFLSDLNIQEGILVALGLMKSDDHKIFLTPRLSLKTSVTDIEGLNLYGKSIEKIRDAHADVDASPVIQAQHLLVQALQFSKTNLEEFIDKSKERTMAALIENVSSFLKKFTLPQSPKVDLAACSVLSRLHDEDIYDPNVLIRLVQKHHIVPTREFNRNQIKLTIFESFVEHVTREKNAPEMMILRFQIPTCVLKTKYLNVLPNMRDKLPASIFEKSDELESILNIPSDEDVQRFTTREIKEEVKKSKERTKAIIDQKQILLPQDTSIPFHAPLFSGTNQPVVEFQSVLHFILIRWLNYLRENDADDFSFLLFENVANLLRKSLDIERDIIRRRLISWMRIGMDEKFSTFNMKTLLYHLNILIKNDKFELNFDSTVSDLEQQILWENMVRAFEEIKKGQVIDESVVVNMFVNEYSTHMDKIATITSKHLSKEISSRFSPHIDCIDTKIDDFIKNILMSMDSLTELDIVNRFIRKMPNKPNNLTMAGKIVCFSLARNSEERLSERIKLFLKRTISRIPLSDKGSLGHFWTKEDFGKYIFHVLIGTEMRVESHKQLSLNDIERLIYEHRNDTLFFRLNMFECNKS